MKKTIIGSPLGALLAQQAKGIPRIGYLTGTPLSVIPYRVETFRRGLREPGCVKDAPAEHQLTFHF
jgi:hypothetical protein